MASFSEGLLSGLRNMGQGSGVPADPRARNLMEQYGVTNPLLQQFGQSLGGLFGVDTRSPMAIQQSQAQEALKGLPQANSPEQLLKIAQQLINSGNTEQGVALVKQAREMQLQQAKRLQEQKQRESLAQRATTLGLTDTAEFVSGGGDLKEAYKAIKEAEADSIQGKGDRKARVRLALQFSNPETAKAVNRGEYDGMSNTEFLDMVKGTEGTIKGFQLPDGSIKSLPVLGNKVFDDQSNQWVFPSALGLAPAPQVQKVIDVGNELTKEFTQGAVKRFDRMAEGADLAKEQLKSIANSQALIESGIFSGTTANLAKDITNLGVSLGIIDPNSDMAKRGTATEQYIIEQLGQMSAIMKDFGAGTGISDKDVQIALQRIGADPTLRNETLRGLLAKMQKQAEDFLGKYNDVYDVLTEQGLDPRIMEIYRVSPEIPATAAPILTPEQPPVSSTQLSPSALKYLGQ